MFKKIKSMMDDALWITRYGIKDNIPRVTCAILGFALIFITSAVGELSEYPVSPGDTLYISVWGQEALSGPVMVGPDGAIVLQPPVGSVHVNQLTANEIAELLTRKLEEYIKQPRVTVSIRAFQGFIVHILGQVQSPSFYRIPDGTSVQELITRAGGFTRLADPRAIVLIRKEGEKAEKRKIDFSRFLKQSDMEGNPILRANDVVLVPRLDMNERARQLVTVVGQVGNPGSYELETPMPLLDVLALADGVSDNADLRNVFILSRREGAAGKVDLEAMLSGKGNPHSLGPAISPGEIIFIPNTKSLEDRAFSVNVIGQVAKPGSYLTTEGTRLIDAIFKAGGFAEEASVDNIAVVHADDGSSAISLFSLRDYLLTGNIEANPDLHEGDTIVVPAIKTAKVVSPVQTAFSSSITVSVIGEVAKPGAYQISTESNLLDVLTLAGGPTSGADLERTMIVRGSGAAHASSVQGKQQFRIDLEEVMTEGNLDLLPVMLPGDTLFIPRVKERRNWWHSAVQIAGDIGTIVIVYYLLTGKTYRR
jgi:protein involved in polysaccharide export with SLBB domain